MLAQREVAEPCDALGAIDFSRFRRDVAEGRIRYVVTRLDDRPAPILGARFDHYTKIREFGRHTVYAVRDSTSGADAPPGTR